MAVYEHTYKPYTGPMTPEWSRFMIIPRDAYRSVFRSKLFTAFFALCFIYPLVAAILIYLHHNINAIGILKVRVDELVPINASFFLAFIATQGIIGFFLTMLVGPPLVSRDLVNNALPLYLCRPFSRAEYVVGKMSVILILLSLITWVPGLLLFFFQSYLEGWKWFSENVWMIGSILFGSWVWMLTIALLALALSAWVKWRIVASAAMLGIFFIPAAFSEVINELFNTRWGFLINIGRVMESVWASLFNQPYDMQLPLWSAWMMLCLICATCLLLLYRKVRAYEVIR